MKALVTGATGFVGSHLAEALRQRGDEVTALVRSPTKAGLLSRWNVRMVSGDLQDSGALREAVAGQDVVFHVAGLITARNEAAFLHGNRDGTANLVEAVCRGGSPRFILVSSLAVGGPSTPGVPLKGDEPPNPVTPYGRSKLAAEAAVRASPLPWSIVRPPVVFGPRDYEVLRLFRMAKIGFAPVLGDGRQELSTVYAPDLAQALLSVAVQDAAVGKVYYACNPAWCTSAEFVRAIGQSLGKTTRVVPVAKPVGLALLAVGGVAAALSRRATLFSLDKANEFFAPAWTADPAALARDTGWVAANDLAAGLKATAGWYREAGWI